MKLKNLKYKTQISNQAQNPKSKKFLQFWFWTLFVIWIWSFGFLNAAKAQELEVDLNWHCSTLVPSWYQGRALPVRGSTLTVAALTTQETLIYDWYLDKNYIKYASGLDRDNFSFMVTEWPGYEHNVSLKVYSQDGTITGYASISIDVQEPEVHLGAREYTLSPSQTKVFQAIPYFFTSENLKYQWLFDNQEVKNDHSNVFNLNISPDSGPGTRKLDIVVSNPNNLLEKARERVIINIK